MAMRGTVSSREMYGCAMRKLGGAVAVALGFWVRKRRGSMTQMGKTLLREGLNQLRRKASKILFNHPYMNAMAKSEESSQWANG